METLEGLKEIIAGKPDGATHINDSGGYIGEGYTGILLHHELGGWHDFDCNTGMRSLSDIERIIELMEWQVEANKNYQSMMEAYLND